MQMAATNAGKHVLSESFLPLKTMLLFKTNEPKQHHLCYQCIPPSHHNTSLRPALNVTIPAKSKQRSRKIDIVRAKPNQRTQPTTQI
jgi:hypothetical protein